MLLAAVLLGSPFQAAAGDRPFRATVTGNAHLSPTTDPCVFRNDETGQGTASHLGGFIWADVEYVNFCTVPGGVAVEASFTMTAGNGDELHGEFTTTGTFQPDGTLDIHGTYEFLGGTGRFSDASGAGRLDATAYFGTNFPFDGQFDGSIDY